jgi:hypothetical protein
MVYTDDINFANNAAKENKGSSIKERRIRK